MAYFDKLQGLRFRDITIGSAAHSMGFDGKIGDEYFRYSLSSMFETCFDASDVFKKDFIRDRIFLKVWDYFDRVLEAIEISPDGRVCELKMSGGLSIYVWSHELKHDNLIVATRWESDEWFTIG